MAMLKWTSRQAMIHKALHRKLEQHECSEKVSNSGIRRVLIVNKVSLTCKHMFIPTTLFSSRGDRP